MYNFLHEHEVSVLESIILLHSSATSASSPNPEMTVAALSCHCCSSCLPSLASPDASIESSLASVRSLLGSVAARLPRVSTKKSGCDVSSVLSSPPATSSPTDLRYMPKSQSMVAVSRTRKSWGTSVREDGVLSTEVSDVRSRLPRAPLMVSANHCNSPAEQQSAPQRSCRLRNQFGAPSGTAMTTHSTLPRYLY